MSISAWVMSIAGISVLTLLVDVVMPDGETAKYVKGIFAIFVVFAIVSPLPALLSSGISFESFLGESKTASVDYGYIDYSNKLKKAYLEFEIEKYLAENGVTGAEVVVVAEFNLSEMTLKAINADLSRAIISDSIASGNVKEKTVQLINEITNVKKENIVVYGNG